jgi:hypothetical protein
LASKPLGKDDPRFLGSRRLYRLFHREKVNIDPGQSEQSKIVGPTDDDISNIFKIIAATKLQAELEPSSVSTSQPPAAAAKVSTPQQPASAKVPAVSPALDEAAFIARMAQLADAVEQTIEVNALPEDCFRVAADFERYPLWAGSVQYVKVLEQVAGSDLWAGSVQNVKVLEQVDRGDLGRRAEFSVGAFGTSLSYTLEYDYDPPRRMRWTAVAGGVKELLGVYEFSPLADGRTQVPRRRPNGRQRPHSRRREREREREGGRETDR